ncbi:MAG: hypothetical protein K9K81_03675 [Desulfobacteraceae bacterium]|nr:hypothetical protein [Desulfobacteraceae bacterium]
MKRSLLILTGLCVSFLFLTIQPSEAKMKTGEVVSKFSDMNIQIFGSATTQPIFVANPDFNDESTPLEYIGDTGGNYADHSIRQQLRLGLEGGGENWSFMTLLEGEFVMDKDNVDRTRDVGADEGWDAPSGVYGDQFGIEALVLTYDFNTFGNSPVTLESGWSIKGLDLATGGLVYGDDHPYLGLTGSFNDVDWALRYHTIEEDLETTDSELISQEQDWRFYSLKFNIPLMNQNLNVSPFYAYSDNRERDAKIHYVATEFFGTLGRLTPRAEFVYVTGEKANYPATDEDADVSSYAAFASLEYKVSSSFQPYFGGYLVAGDDDANDSEINAYNGITDGQFATPTFGNPNAFAYKTVESLGTIVYSMLPALLGNDLANGPAPWVVGTGYGGVGNTSSAYHPGLTSIGAGFKGRWDKFDYKVQFQYLMFTETGAMEDLTGTEIDDEMGSELSANLTYRFNPHFSLGTTLSLFSPGNGTQDILEAKYPDTGGDWDEIALCNYIEMTWRF